MGDSGLDGELDEEIAWLLVEASREVRIWLNGLVRFRKDHYLY